MAAETPTDRITKLRLQLKTWEHNFAKTHSGTKPSTADIKADPSIAAKYKEYYKLLKPSKEHKPSLPPPIPKRPAPPETTATPSRSTGAVPWTENEVYESPASVRRQRLFGNRTTRDCVGPTPQKTGRVLGLFDSFIDVSLTPTKTPLEDAKSINRAPASASPITPRKRKRLEHDTPSKKILQTPTALRAPVPSALDLTISPPAFRPPPRLKRGLSSMVAELRQLVDHAHDDEEEAMRDMEMEAEGIVKVPEPKQPVESEPELPPLPPGAFREEELVDEDAGKEVEGRRWKKKGLKRQTRRVKMRPVTVPKAKSEGDNRAEEEAGTGTEDEGDGKDSGSEFEGEDGEPAAPKRAKKSAKQDVSSAKLTAKDGKTSLAAKGKEVVKKAGRKISNTAHSHMNFRKLNIKNKNSKGKGGGGRWGKRR